MPASNALDFIIRVKTTIPPFCAVGGARPTTNNTKFTKPQYISTVGNTRTEKLVDITNKKTRKAASQEHFLKVVLSDELLFIFLQNFKKGTVKISDNCEHVTCSSPAEIINPFILVKQLIDRFKDINPASQSVHFTNILAC